jgi:hypothetical protein
MLPDVAFDLSFVGEERLGHQYLLASKSVDPASHRRAPAFKILLIRTKQKTKCFLMSHLI